MKNMKKEYYFIAVLFICFVALTLFVILGKTNMLDEMIFNGLIRFENDLITKILYVITNLASTIGIIVLLIITAIFFIKKKSFSDFKYVMVNVGVGVILMQVLKMIIRRTRPSWKWIIQSGFSYPSGHTISSLLFYGTLILLVYKKVDGKLKKPLIIIFSLMIILTAISRVYFGAHYLTDVIASILLGFIILIISSLFMDREFSNDKNKNRKTIQTK